jgi:hypothetical protein
VSHFQIATRPVKADATAGNYPSVREDLSDDAFVFLEKLNLSWAVAGLDFDGDWNGCAADYALRPLSTPAKAFDTFSQLGYEAESMSKSKTLVVKASEELFLH